MTAPKVKLESISYRSFFPLPCFHKELATQNEFCAHLPNVRNEQTPFSTQFIGKCTKNSTREESANRRCRSDDFRLCISQDFPIEIGSDQW